jgi:hypothetical protein
MNYQVIVPRNPTGVNEEEERANALYNLFADHYQRSMGMSLELAMEREGMKLGYKEDRVYIIQQPVKDMIQNIDTHTMYIFDNIFMLHAWIWRIKKLPNPPTIQKVIILGSKIIYNDKLGELLRQIPGLERVSFGASSHLVLFPGFFNGWPSIKSLDITRAHWGAGVQLTSYCFQGLDSLEKLDLINFDYSLIPFGLFFGLSKLKKLHLQGSPKSQPIEFSLEKLNNLDHVEEIYIGGAPCKNMTLTDSVPRLNHLCVISFTDEIIGIKDKKAFKSLPNLKTVNFPRSDPTGVVNDLVFHDSAIVWHGHLRMWKCYDADAE